MTPDEQFYPETYWYRRIDVVQQLARYYFIVEMLKSYGITGKVLEAGCGSGIGADIFVRSGFAVVAFDNDAKAIQYAKEHFGGVAYDTLEVGDPKIPQVEAVVALELLEHLDKFYTGFNFLRERASKLFVFSTPYKEPPGLYDFSHHKTFNIDEKMYPSETRFFYQTQDGLIYPTPPSHMPALTLIGVLTNGGKSKLHRC